MEEERQYRTDEQLEAMLSDYDVKEPAITCYCQKKTSRVCLNSDCDKSAFMCNEIDCKVCGIDAHSRCLNIPLRGLTEIIGDRALRQKKFLEDICKIQNQFIEELYHSRKELTKKYYLGDLEQKYMKIFYDIFKDKQRVDYLKGKQAKEFYQRLIKINEQANQNTNLLLQNYRRSIKTMVDSMVDLKKKVYQSFVKVSAVRDESFQIDSNILKNPLLTKLNQFKEYESVIVKHCMSLIDELTAEQGQFLKKILNNPRNIQLLYRASENNFTAESFHKKSDNIPNTLVLVRTEFGKTFGGFTQYTWNAVSNTSVNEIDMKQKFIPQNKNNLIYCFPNYGPFFGGGHDFYIYDKCNTNNSSSSAFPGTYNREGQNKLVQNQDSYTSFCGAPSGSNFRVVEYQVFRVAY